MALLNGIAEDDFYIGLWRLEETAGKLAEGVALSQSDLSLLASFSSERRKREFLAVRHLLKQSPAMGLEIVYDDAGRPFLPGYKGYVSISHSEDLAALLLSQSPAGIDVEQIARNTDRIVPKFLGDGEIAWTALSSNPRHSRILCWCAKEAVFKMAATSSVDFKGQIVIYPFELQDSGTMRATFTDGQKKILICLKYIHAVNNAVVWCVENVKQNNYEKT